MPSSDFRITQHTVSRRVMENLQTNLSRLGTLQGQISSLRKLQRPSDSPVGAVSALRLRGDLARSEQVGRNIDDAMGWLGTADNTLTVVVEQIQRVRELAVTGRNAPLDAASREGLAMEVEKIRETIVGLANTRYGDRPVFGGTVSGAISYDTTATYVGNSTAIERTVAPGVRVQINVTGDAIFGPAGNDLFVQLNQIANALRTAPSQLDTLVTTLDTSTQTIQSNLAEVGARYKRVETMKDRNDVGALTMKQDLSAVEDVDLAKAVMDLQMQETAYQAALQATARVIQPSLVDFLR